MSLFLLGTLGYFGQNAGHGRFVTPPIDCFKGDF